MRIKLMIEEKLGMKAAEMTISELSKAILKGMSFSCGYYNNGKWSQQLFGLDFSYDDCTLKKFTIISEEYKVVPSLIYYTTDGNPKYTALFTIDNPIADRRVRFLIHNALTKLFFNDKSQVLKDETRKLKGGETLISLNLKATINILDLVMSLYLKYGVEDLHHHMARSIKRFCRESHLHHRSQVPSLTFLNPTSNKISTKYAYYYKCKCYPNATIAINFDIPEEQFNPVVDTFRCGKKLNMAKENDDLETIFNLKRGYTLDEYIKDCSLATAFETNRQILLPHELNHLLLRYIQVQGGEKKYNRALKDQVKNDFDLVNKKTKYLIKWSKANNYHPFNCNSKNCRYFKTCLSQGKIFWNKFSVKQGEIRQIKDFKTRTVEEIRFDLKERFKRILANEDNKIYGIKAPTGIGKTELYLTEHDVLIAAPTHALIKEIADRMVEVGNEVITVSELPFRTEVERERIETHYRAGNFQYANQEIKSMIKAIRNKSDEKTEKELAILDYQNNIGLFNNTKKTTLITHERLSYSYNLKQKYIIIDEDPLDSILKIGTVFKKDLLHLQTLLTNNPIRKEFDALINCIEVIPYHDKNNDKVYQTKEVQIPIKYIKNLESIVSKEAIKFESNILGFLKSHFFVKEKYGDSYKISFLTVRELPRDKKIIILSATIEEDFYKRLYGERFVFEDLGFVKTEGEIIQHYDYSYSRASIDKDPIAIFSKIKKYVGDIDFITFKKYRKQLDNLKIRLHFGAVEGVNELAGQNIAVIGTPHIVASTYFLYAAALGYDLSQDNKADYISIEENGFEFWFYTFVNNKDLRRIQLKKIEAGLQQAIGRARILENNCKVYLFSNYPMPGAKM